jgi:hypothetical protein
MTWTYNTSLSAAQDQVRFYSGDTDSAAAITLSDEEILGAITLAGSARAAAALICENLAGRYSTVGRQLQDDIGQSIDYGERATFFQARAVQLRSRVSLLALPFAGGISIAAKQAEEVRSDRVSPAFTKTLHDDPNADTNSELTEV